MKIFLTLVSIVILTTSGIAQTTKSKDTSEICIPYGVAQKILLDLNEYDKLKELSKSYQNEIIQLDKKTEILKKENESLVKNNEYNEKIISEKNNVVKIYTSENEDLKKENKRLKTKNGLYTIISAVIIAPLTYIAIFK